MENIDNKTSRSIVQKADFIVSVRRTPKSTFLNGLKYFFCFWLKKPNTTIQMIKNRYGKPSIYDVYINYSKQ